MASCSRNGMGYGITYEEQVVLKDKRKASSSFYCSGSTRSETSRLDKLTSSNYITAHALSFDKVLFDQKCNSNIL